MSTFFYMGHRIFRVIISNLGLFCALVWNPKIQKCYIKVSGGIFPSVSQLTKIIWPWQSCMQTYCCSPFKPQDQHTNSPDWSLYISFKNSWENLIKDQSILPLVINLVILITFTLDDLLMLLGENWCWSLLGPEGLMVCTSYKTTCNVLTHTQ